MSKIFDGEKVIANGFLTVDEQGMIEHFASGNPPDSLNGTILSRPGHTLLPGLIDAHIHADNANEIALPQSLRFGVTTACDMGNDPQHLRTLFRQIATEGEGVCADLKSAQFAATVDGGWPLAVITAHNNSPEMLAELAQWPQLVTPEDGRRYVNDMLKEEGGLDYVKLVHESGAGMGLKLPKPSLELQRAVIDEAHRHGLKVVAHATNLTDTLEILDAGADGTTHVISDQPPTEELIAAYKRRGAHCNPTLATVGSLTTEGLKTQERYAVDPRVVPLLADASKASMHECMGMCKNVDGVTVENAYESVRQLHQAGIEIICGSDAAGPARGSAWGLSVHHELGLFVEHCGFSPVQALRSATFAVAECLNLRDRGSLQPGKRADLLLVHGDPTVDIDHTLNIRRVWKKGVPAVAHPVM